MLRPRFANMAFALRSFGAGSRLLEGVKQGRRPAGTGGRYSSTSTDARSRAAKLSRSTCSALSARETML